MSKNFCKDCKHCKITEEDSDSNDPLFPVTRTLEFVECPISTWFEQVWCIIESGFYENGGYICDLETLQPPPNCNCFEPKKLTPYIIEGDKRWIDKTPVTIHNEEWSVREVE